MLRHDTFIHVQTPKGRSLGWSALMSPVQAERGPIMGIDNQNNLNVWLATTRCNAHDRHFNKKIARAVLREKQQELVKVRDLPAIFAYLSEKCAAKGRCLYYPDDFNFVLRKFV